MPSNTHLWLSVQQAFLDGEDLLRNSGQDALLETVELVETSPCAHLNRDDVT